MTTRDEIQAVLNAYVAAYRAGDAKGCAAIFAEDAQLHSPYAPPAIGRAAIAALHVDWVQDGGNKTLTVEEAGASGDLAWCLARFAEGAETGDGTTLAVLERHGEDWLIRMCCLNEAPAG
ncbi:YybH family protein [Thetidibacter halocola]|uniref:Nuclear transport factor 2 family protein n=1 Tax=Thetidibacter halocola TaxID=2827239 RepID=A0A8J7WAS3_9RHOB|nr:nuclear transport factor 2 family protein [Thetidibacter halocola]MBS0123044.1 nuclear transport factor 2 family protein [Thetidibacter halocola]